MSVPIKSTAVGRVVIDLPAQGIHYVWPEQGAVIEVADEDLLDILPYFTPFNLTNLAQIGPNMADTLGPLVDGEALDLVSIPVAEGAAIGGVISALAVASDGTDTVATTVKREFSANNKAGTVTCSFATAVMVEDDAGELAMSAVIGATPGEDEVTFTLTPTITGTPTRSGVRYELNLLSPVELTANPEEV